MISPRGGRIRDERLREDSDPEDEVVQRSPATITLSGKARHRRRGSSAPNPLDQVIQHQQSLASIPTAVAPVGASAPVRPPSQDLAGLEEGIGAADPNPPPPHNSSTSLWPRRRSAHVSRRASKHDGFLAAVTAAAAAAGPGGGSAVVSASGHGHRSASGHGHRSASGHGHSASESQHQLENEAPIRGLAKQMSRLEMPQKAPKKSNHPQHRKIDSLGGNNTIGSWLTSHTRTPSRAQPTAPTVPTDEVDPVVAPGDGSGIPLSLEVEAMSGGGGSQGGGAPVALEHGGAGGILGIFGGAPVGHASGRHASGGHMSGGPPGIGGVVGPETPPPLRDQNRRANLVKDKVEEEPPEEIEQELMIGEIKSVSMDVELMLVRRALVIIVLSVTIAVVVRRSVGPIATGTNIILMVSFVSALLLSFPFIRFMARLFAYLVTTRASGLLYRGNRYYFVVALHYDIAITVWSIFSVIFWKEMFHPWVYTDDELVSRMIHDYGDKVLQCHLALRVGILVKNFLVLLVATCYLWRPYLRRVQSSILAQYILLMLTDYCTKGACNPDDQKFALEMGKQGIQDNISLYAVSKAMGFIPRNKLGHRFFRELAGSDTLDSSKDATLLGNFLFSELLFSSRPPVTPPPRRDMGLAAQGGSDPGPNRIHPRDRIKSSQTQQTSRFTVIKRHSEPQFNGGFFESSPAPQRAKDLVEKYPKDTGNGGGGVQGKDGSNDNHDESFSLVSTPVVDSLLNSFSKLITAGERAFGSTQTSGGEHGSDDYGADEDADISSKSARHRKQVNAHKVAGADSDKDQDQVQEPSVGNSDGGGGCTGDGKGDRMSVVVEESLSWTAREVVDSTDVGRASGTRDVVADAADAENVADTAADEKKDPGEGMEAESRCSMGDRHHAAKRRDNDDDSDESGGRAISTSSGEENDEETEVLMRKTFCPALHPDLLNVAFKIFDFDDNGTVTKEEMVLGVVGTFKDHRSLALTLQDSEHIARKLGLLIMALIFFILVFVWLSIWGADVVQLSVTFASFLIAISFMIGTAASNLVTSVLFIFITRLYDVGDRVHIYNDGDTSSKPTDVTVVKVDLLITVFKRWDEQVFYMPNYLLASKTIVNIQRTAHQWHEFYINIAANTPSSKIKALHTWLQNFAKSKDKPEGLYSRISFSLTSIEDSNRLNIRITFRQRGNWQSMEKKWACQSMCTWAIKNGCESIGISYAMPEVPIRVKHKLH